MEKKEITLAEVLSLTGPAQHITVVNESRSISDKSIPIYKGIRIRLTRSNDYEALKDRKIKMMTTVFDDLKIENSLQAAVKSGNEKEIMEAVKKERGMYIVLWNE